MPRPPHPTSLFPVAIGVLLVALVSAAAARPARAPVSVASADPLANPRAVPATLGNRADAFVIVTRPVSPPPGTDTRSARPPLEVERATRNLGGSIEPEFPGDGEPFSRFWIVRLGAGAALESALGRFSALAGVEGAYPIALVPALAVPNDSLWNVAYYFRQPSGRDVRATEAWDVTTGDTSVIVAITDTGVLTDHPDLRGQFFRNAIEANGVPGIDDDGNGFVDDAQGWDFVDLAPSVEVRFGEDGRGEDNDPSDFAGHGTAVAGLVGARTNNRLGVAGTAWKVRLMPLRIGWSSPQYPSGEGDVSYIARGIRYATLMGAKIVNCSFVTANQPDLVAAVDAAVAAGVRIVTAAGNFGVTHYLAQREDVISVTSTDQDDVVPLWATTGPTVDLAAPGYRMASTTVDRDDQGHRFPDYTVGASGTSFSSPVVAGAVALLDAVALARHQSPLSPFATRLRLMDTADDIADRNVGGAGHGSGRLDLLRALTDPPMSRVAATAARMSGPAAMLAGSTGGPNLVALATRDARVLVIDGAAGAIEAQAPLSAVPAGGVAAAAMDGVASMGIFVATLDGRIHGFDRALVPLPGWPVSTPVSATASTREPVLGDLDGDGLLEVVWCGGGDGRVRVWRANGNEFETAFSTDVGSDNLTIAVSDLDGVPGVELVIGGDRLTVLHADGRPLSANWPRTTPIQYAPLVVGLGLGRLPTVISSGFGRVEALTPEGNFRWRREVDVNQAPIPMDLEGDGSDELVLMRTSPLSVGLIDSRTGADVPGWTPASMPTGTLLGPPLVGALGSPGAIDVLVPHASRGLMAFRPDGLPIRGFPKPGNGVTFPLIADLDNDGATDVFAGSSVDSSLYFYEIRGGTWREPTSPWSTARGNGARTGSTLYVPEIGDGDSLRPLAVADLAVRAVGPGRVELEWTAPAGARGETVSRYDLRYSTEPIDTANVYFARSVGGPVPAPPGTRQSAVVGGLDETETFQFVLRSHSYGRAWSELSNQVHATTPAFPPDRVSDLRWATRTDTSVTLSWTATGDDARLGRPARYRIRAADAPLDDSNFEAAPHRWEVLAAAAGGGLEIATLTGLPREQRFQVALVAVDDENNASTVSNSVEVSTATLPPARVGDLRVRGRSDVRVSFEWTASGDDGRAGRARGYEVRVGTEPFDDATIARSWAIAEVPGTVEGGRGERATVSGFAPGLQQYVAFVTLDPVGNRSPISNLISVATLDVPVPGVDDLAITPGAEDALALTWHQPAGALTGVARYPIRGSLEPLTESNFDAAPYRWEIAAGPSAGQVERTIVGGLAQNRHYWVALAAQDSLGIRSRISNVVEITTVAIPPAAVTDLRWSAHTDTSFTLRWTATGDDDRVGRPVLYRIRAALAPLADSTFDESPPQWQIPARVAGGSVETVTLGGLARESRYWLALVAVDDQGNASSVSNSAEVLTATVPPAPVSDLHVLMRSDVRVSLEWTASGDDGRVGRARGYEVRVSDRPFETTLPDQSRLLGEVPATVAANGAERAIVSGLTPGALQFIGLVTVDPLGNRSPLSNLVAVTMLEGPVPAITTLSIVGQTETELSFSWVNPGDALNAVYGYRLCAATEALTDSSFDAAPLRWNFPDPGQNATVFQTVISGLQQNQHFWFGVVALGAGGLRSRLASAIEITTTPIPPDPITDFRILAFANTRVTFRWTGTGEDHRVGQPNLYVVRAAEEPLDSAAFARAALEWIVAPQGAAGTAQNATLQGFEYGHHYWTAVRAIDHRGNPSELSNVAEIELADTPPAAVSDLRILERIDRRVALQWTATGGDAQFGRPRSYWVRAATQAMDSVVFEGAPLVWEVPARFDAGGVETFRITDLGAFTTYWYGIRAVDSTGHVSALSNVVSARTTAIPPSTVNTLYLQTLSDTVLTIRWTASGEDAMTGWPRMNHLRAAEAPITDSTFDRAPYAWEVRPTVAGRSTQSTLIRDFPKNKRLWFAVVVEDSSGNRSRVSNNIVVTTIQVPPGRVSGLRVLSTSDDGVTLTWFATGEDGAVGYASRYLVRAGPAALDSAAFESAPLRWELGSSLTWYETVDLQSSALEGHFWFAVVAEDRSGNRSPVSNNVEITTPLRPPAAVPDLEVLDRGDSTVTLAWTATGDDDNIGRPRLYRIRAAATPPDSASFERVTSRWEVLAVVAAGEREHATLAVSGTARLYWFSIQAEDDAGNLSPVTKQVDAPTPTLARWAVNGLEAVARPRGGVRLSWRVSGSSESPQGYRIVASERPLDDAGFDAVALRWEVAAAGRDRVPEAELVLAAERRWWIGVAAMGEDGVRSPMSAPVSVWVGRLAGGGGPMLVAERQPARAPVRLLWRTAGVNASRALSIYDARGRLLYARPLAGEERAGVALWDGRDRAGHAAPPGLYFARLSDAGFSITARIVLLE